MNLTVLNIFYSLFSLTFSIFMVWLTHYIRSSRMHRKFFLIAPMIIGIVAIFNYTIFLLSHSYIISLLFDALFFIGTDWLALSMLMFSISYTESKRPHRFFKWFFIIGASIDSVSLLLNVFTRHSFDLFQLFTAAGYSYWGANFTAVHYLHLGFCYIMVVTTLLILFVNSIKAPAYYKVKYVTIFIAYLVVIIANMLSYSLNSPIDFSVILYAVLASFIAYYSGYTFPVYLVNKTLHTINENLNDAILYFDYSGKLIYHNKACETIFAKKASNLEIYTEQFRLLFLEDKPEEMSLTLNNGEIHHFKTEYKDFFIHDAIVGSYLKLEDKTEEISTSQHRRYVATHDGLTGLLNRNGFFEEVEKALNDGVFKHPILLCSNIKDFRLINDIFGEATGDKVLQNQALMMKKSGHRKNINGHLCDDKFALVMEKEDFHKEIFEESFLTLSTLTEAGVYQMAISVGIYEIYNKKESVAVMYDKAKMAMDSISSDYQTMFAWYDSTMMDKLLAEKNIVSDFDHALEDMQFDIYLQPTLEKDGQIIGAEALARWKHPHQQLILPETFIDILERTGLMYRLDMYIWDLAIRKLKEWEKKGLDMFIAINISARDKYYIDVAETIISIADSYKVDKTHVVIEVQERAFIEDTSKAMINFSKLKEAGFKIFIDRFGSGFSSLNMLKDFEATGIKIDTTFLAEDELSNKNKVILTTMLNLAQDLDMVVVAQGVETKGQLKSLENLNCKFFQGYYFSKPLPVKEFESLYLKTEK